MKLTPLEFEKPLVELEQSIEALKVRAQEHAGHEQVLPEPPQVQVLRGQGFREQPQRPLPQAIPDTPIAVYQVCRETPPADYTAGRRGQGHPED